ncbi:hypothetical protein GTQ40_13830 [Flavobacteriaceae bacterium R38]|nr:hypothetical protein [Flavobacteriaceae bacterium R38]
MIYITTGTNIKEKTSFFRLKDLFDNYHLSINPEQKEIILKEGQKTYKGDLEIHQFLDRYENNFSIPV